MSLKTRLEAGDREVAHAPELRHVFARSWKIGDAASIARNRGDSSTWLKLGHKATGALRHDELVRPLRLRPRAKGALSDAVRQRPDQQCASTRFRAHI